jgi:tetratricopeptide (TPR) repeat protein
MRTLSGDTLGHYRILEPLGSGGMGDVYRAEDLRLRRSVALKMLRGADGDEGALLAEARAASALNHPHIAVVYEIGQAPGEDGQPVDYIAMEYVEGTTLAGLAARGPIDLDTALDICEQIADALADAERHRIVHRDLKPANVMVTPAGRVKVLDFGIARRRAPARLGPDDPTHTSADAEVVSGFSGTIPYAAPEQMTGRAVDTRADLFSLGVIAYELVAGRRPFDGTAAQVLEAMLLAPAPALPNAAADPRLVELERLIGELLAPDRERRLASAAGLRRRFGSIRVAAAQADVTPGVSTLMVGGFTNISGGSDDDWVGTGLAETLTADASQLEGLTVLPRDRVAETLKTLRQETGEPDDRLFLRAARNLKARWIVSGAFQRAGDAIRVTATVIDGSAGQLVRSVKVDGTLGAIFDLQDRLVRELAAALRGAVSPVSVAPETEIVEAYEAFSRGLLNRRGETYDMLDRAVTLFERAIALDPSYARAHVELGVAYSAKADYLSMRELHLRGLTMLRRAVDLQPGSARAWRELGATLMTINQDDEGMAALRHALAIDPGDASVLASIARAHFINYARFAEAAEWYERAVTRNPDAGWYWLQLAHCAALMRDFPRGTDAAARAVELQEAFLSGREGLAIAGASIRAGHLAALQGRHDQAIDHFQREIDFLVRTDHPLRYRILVELNERLGASYGQLGDHRKAEAMFAIGLDSFERRVRLGADEPFSRYYAAAIHALRGDAEPALALLQRALTQQPAFTAARAAIEPEFDALRGDQRFHRMLQEKGA